MRIKYHPIIIGRGASIDLNSSFLGKNAIGIKTRFRGELGYGSYIGNGCNINAKVGKYSCVGSSVSVISGTHPSSTFVSIHPMFYSTQKQNGYTYVDRDSFKEVKFADDYGHSIIIGNDVWIGSNVTLLGGITIGNGSIVASGAVVTKDVGDYEIVGGVPARIIRHRFSEEQIRFLQTDKWWEKEEDWIQDHIEWFNDIEDYISLCQDNRL